MICRLCQKAGRKNAKANELDREGRWLVVVNNVKAAARLLHTGCPGGTQCDCQHVVGMVVK